MKQVHLPQKENILNKEFSIKNIETKLKKKNENNDYEDVYKNQLSIIKEIKGKELA